MADLNAEQVQVTGTDPTYNAAAAGGDTVPTGDDIYVHVKNDDTASHTVTVVTPGTVAGQAIGDVAVAVPAGEARFIGPITREHFGNADARADLTYDDVTAVTLAVLRT